MAKDMFSGSSLSNMGRYIAADAEAHRLERAKELDERIREFSSRKRDIAWCDEAKDFCERETLANKDIFDVSAEAARLPQILEEAEGLRQKFKKDADAARAAAAQSKIDKAREIDERIKALVSAARSRYWVDEVLGLVTEVSRLDRDIKLKCRELDKLDDLDRERSDVIEAEEADGSVRFLERQQMTDETSSRVIKLYEEMSPAVADRMKEYKRLEALYEKAVAKKYSRDFGPYEELLRAVERSNAPSGFDGEFKALDRGIARLPFDIAKYVKDFDRRWESARDKIDDAVRSENDKKRAREKAEADAKAAKAAAAAENARRQTADEYEHFLAQVEEGSVSEVYSEFDSLEKKRKTLDFYLESYIDNFVKRWASAKSEVAAEKARLKKIDDEKKAEAAAKARAAAEAREKAKRKQAAKEKRAAFFGALFKAIGPFLPYLIIAAGGFIAGLIVTEAQNWLFGLGASAAALMLTERVSSLVRKIDLDWIWLGGLVNFIPSILAVVFAFIGFGEISICLIAPTVIGAIIILVRSEGAYSYSHRHSRGLNFIYSWGDHERAVYFAAFSNLPVFVGAGLALAFLFFEGTLLALSICAAAGAVLAIVALLIMACVGDSSIGSDAEGLINAIDIIAMIAGAAGLVLAFIPMLSIAGMITAAASLVVAGITLIFYFCTESDTEMPLCAMLICFIAALFAAVIWGIML